MLLSKPKKDYRSVSKTDLLKEQQEPHQESATESGDFYEYDEIKAGNEEVLLTDLMWLTIICSHLLVDG